MGTRWSRDTIALEILRRYAAGEPLNYSEVQRSALHLLRAATRYFGSWQQAIEYAGLDYEAIRRYRTWTRERIVERIRAYHAEGQDLSWRHVSTQLNPALAAAAIRESGFGSWQAALEAAGIPYESVRRHRAWSAARVLEELRGRHARGESLRVSDVAAEAPALVAAARRRFGGWYEAVVAAGLDELEARIGLGEWDPDTARGELSWGERKASENGAAGTRNGAEADESAPEREASLDPADPKAPAARV